GLPSVWRRAAIAPKRGQVIVRVGDVVAGAAISDFEIDDIAFATVDEVVPVRFALGKPGGHPRPQHRLPGIGNQSRLANSSSSECQWRSAEAVPGGRRVKFTPNDVSPSGSPSARFSRAANGSRKCSGYAAPRRGSTDAGSRTGNGRGFDSDIAKASIISASA